MAPKHQFVTALILASIISCLTVKGQEGGKSFTFNQISESNFRESITNNFNTFPVSIDSSRIEKGLLKIDKTYNQHEIDLASREMCESPRCLTIFEGYYPKLDILLFFIKDYHSNNAVFMNENNPNNGFRRFSCSFGVMSKKGFWIGLERRDNDNHLEIEICKVTPRGTWSIINFDFKSLDIDSSEKQPIIWANENTIYIATISSESRKKEYYEIQFDY